MKKFLMALMVFPTVAMSEPDPYAECKFHLECFEGETCSETNFEMTIIRFDHVDAYGDLLFMIESSAETVEGFLIDDKPEDASITMIGKTEATYHVLHMNYPLLKTQTNDEARYSVHMDGPMVISYLGNCEVVE